MNAGRVLCLAAWMVCAAACSTKPNPGGGGDEPGKSPNATIPPAPLASAAPVADTADASSQRVAPADSKGRLGDAGLPQPVAMAAGQALSADTLPGREASGASLTAEWIWTGVPAPIHAPEVAVAGIEASRKLTKRTWIIDLAEFGRMRIAFDSVSFVLTKFTELRARYDRYGHVLVWPDGDRYRVIPPGAMRALLDERRVDVTPLMPERPKTLPSAGPRFGFPTSRTQISTATGKLILDQAHIVNVGLGGPLLCRTMVELVGADPNGSTCAVNDVPVHAEYTWPDNTTIQFDVLSLAMRSDFPSALIAVPPTSGSFAPTGLPPTASGIFLTRDQLVAWRTRAIDMHPRSDPESKGAPGEGVMAVNPADGLRFLVIDGVPVAWVPPHGQQYLIGPPRGRYVVQWRTFLGSHVGQPMTVEFPALLTFGAQADAGAPPPAPSAAPSK